MLCKPALDSFRDVVLSCIEHSFASLHTIVEEQNVVVGN
jgi:hypothetical protein